VLIYFFYRFLGLLAFPLIVLYLLWRGLRDRRYWPGLGERFGSAPHSWNATAPGGIWLHAVSVGEVVSAIELLRQLKREFPAQPLFVSVGTVAGRQIAGEKLKHLADSVFYAPVDLCWTVRRVLRRLQPRLVIVMETEIWPNLYRETKRSGCGLLVVNGRISDRAFPRYRSWRWFFAAVLRWPDLILTQNEIAAERYVSIGAPAARVQVNGNLKYDFRAGELQPPPVVAALRDRLNPVVWIAASTMPPAMDGDPDEDDVVVRSFEELSANHPRLLLMLVPRKPERFDDAARKLQQAGIRFLRRSQLTEQGVIALPAVLLVDTMGELASLFPMADVVFMGGTLPHRGGHNILEPAFFAKPVIVGPHMENFPDIAEEFAAQGAVRQIGSGEELAGCVDRLLRDGAERKAIGEQARVLAESKRGATARAVAAALECHVNALPRHQRPIVSKVLLWPFARVWSLATASDRRRKMIMQRWLQTPVISIGGLAMGGTGKTPLVLYLTEKLNGLGIKPAILTRGYRRSDPEPHTILAAGAKAPVATTGDEAQIFLRAGHAALGIGADRYETGRLVEERLKPDVMLLDDGFQHWKLGRTADIVVLDGMNPLGGSDVFPAGRRREPLGALRRASAFMVAKADMPVPWIGLERLLHHYQPAAPVFYCRMKAVEWAAVGKDETHPADSLPFRRVAAFCGLGNPASFFHTVSQLGLQICFQWAFGDHHAYRVKQLKFLVEHARSERAEAMVMTEKDLMNLPPDLVSLRLGMPLYYLRTRLEVEAEDQFLQWVLEALGRRR